MDKLWAPWRMDYIAHCDDEHEGCVFCEKQNADAEKGLIVYKGTSCFVVMNLYPYNNGHLMIIPYRHLDDVSKLDGAERKELFELTVRAKEVLSDVYRPHGFNIGMNLGRPAGAGIDEHIHMHIVPRWNGDTNFMPVLGETKVLSEALRPSWRKISERFNQG